MATSTEAGSTTQSAHESESASSVALSQRDDSSENEEQDSGKSKLTPKWLLSFFSKDWKHYYRTFELNERLYLHFKGFNEIKCMELFPELKTLYFEGNGLTHISGLETNSQLRCLYLHENCVQKMEGLQALTSLANLNLSDNLITTVEGLSTLENLDMCYLARNRIGRNGLDDLRGLLECPSITTLDLQNNKIDDPACLEEIFVNMPNLKVLYLQGNGCVSKIRNYRKTVISRLPLLKYLDDRPVFDDDRRNAEAFSRGGLEEERKERARIADEKRARDEQNRQSFKDMIRKAREEKRLADAAKAAEEGSASPVQKESGAEFDILGEDNQDEPKTYEVQINTGGEERKENQDDDEDEEAPPELEQVDTEQLKQEQSQADKNQRQMYEQLRKNVADVPNSEEATKEGCTVEEVKEEPAPAEEQEPKEEVVSMAEMISQISTEPENQFVSELEELD